MGGHGVGVGGLRKPLIFPHGCRRPCVSAMGVGDVLARLGLRPSHPELNVLIAGNDCAGKTTLLYRAKTGELRCTVATIGSNVEMLDPLGDNGPQVTAWDVGGSRRIGNIYLHYMCSSAALVFVLRPSDPRVWSALWELYFLVQHACKNGNPGIAVCVVVPVNECAECGACLTWDSTQPASLTEEQRTVSSFAAVARLAERECLPPGGTRRWSDARRWCACEGGNETTTPADEVDSEWLPGWEADRLEVVGSQAAGSQDGHPASRPHRTASHGIEVLLDPKASPPLATVHHGPWVVLPIDMHARAADALLPFQWVARVATAPTNPNTWTRTF